MTSPLSRTAHRDAPLSAAKKPNPLAADAELIARPGDVLIGRSVTINRPREKLYSFWRDFKNLPQFMQNVHSVTIKDQIRSHWTIEAPGGKTVGWDSQITQDEPGRLIAWQSLEGASIRNSGKVEFLDSPDGRGTVVRVTLTYDPPVGAVGKLIARLLMETGEVATARAPFAAPRA
jgi:uncharacterized membrane protein